MTGARVRGVCSLWSRRRGAAGAGPRSLQRVGPLAARRPLVKRGEPVPAALGARLGRSGCGGSGLEGGQR